MALFKQGEIVVDMDTGQQHRVSDGDLELDEKRYGRVAGGPLKESPGMIKQAANVARNAPPAAQAIEGPPGGVPITAQPPRFPGVEKAAREYAIPVATGLAGLLSSGASIPLQAAIGGGGEALSQLASGKPIDPIGIGAAAALPGTVQAGSKVAGYVTRSIANQVGRQPMAKAAGEVIERKMGVGTKAAEAIARAEAKGTPVTNFRNTQNALDDIIANEPRLPGGSAKAKAFADETYDKLSNPANAPFKYNEMFESTQAIRESAEAAGDNRTKKLMYKVRQGLIDDVDQLGPEAKEAFALYRKKQAVKEVSTILNGPGFVGSKITNLLKNDPLVAGAFSAAERKTLETVSSRVGPEGLQKILSVSAGLAGLGTTAMTAPLVIGALLHTPKIGEVFARSLISPSGAVSKIAWPAFAQYMRGYIANQGEQ